MQLGAVITRFGWYPLLFSLAWLLQIYASAGIEPPAAARPAVLAAVIPVACTAVAIRLLGLERGTFVAALLVIALIAARSPLAIVPFLAMIPLLVVERRWSSAGRLRLPWQRMHDALTILAVVLLAIQVGRVATITDPAAASAPDAWAGQPLASGDRPNMYIILADAHGRADILRDLYGYDASPFLRSLEAMEFNVASGSRSNYTLTRFSLASMLTASYLPQVHTSRSPEFQDALTRRTIHENPVFPLLRRAGYEVDVISSGYEHLGLRSADRFIDTGQPNEFEQVYAENIAAMSVLDAVTPEAGLQWIRDRTRAQLDTLLRLASEPENHPRFILLHLSVPHWPFVFTEDCGAAPLLPIQEGGINRHGGTPETVAAVRDQTACVDRMLVAAIGEIVAKDPSAAVILFSDHGPDEHLDWWQPSVDGLDERSAILFAARTPGKPGPFPDDVTLVNVLPTLFNAYLGTDLPSRDNEFWFGPSPLDNRFVQIAPRTSSPAPASPAAQIGSSAAR